MIPGPYNLPAHKRGNTFNGYSFTVFVDIDDVVTPVDFTDAVILMQVRRSANSPVVLEWSTEDDTITISGTDNNIITIKDRVGELMNIEPDTYKFDITAKLANDVTNTYIEGTWPILSNISKMKTA